MKVSSAVVALCATLGSTASAFAPLAHNSVRPKSALCAEEPRTPKGAKTVETAAKTAASTSFTVSKAVPFLAPVAALVAGRQALTKRDVLREQEAITAKDLSRIQKDLANADTTISASFGVAAVTSAIALTNLVGVQFNAPETTSTTGAPSTSVPAKAVKKESTSRAEKKVKTADPPTPRKAPLALRTTKPAAPVEKESAYDVLMSKLNKAVTKPTESAPVADKIPEAQTSKAASVAASTAPSFLDTVMQKVDEKKPEQNIEKTSAVKVVAPAVVESKQDTSEATVPKATIPKADETKVEETPKAVAPLLEAPKPEETKVEAKKIDDVKPDVKKAEETQLVAPPAPEPKPVPKIEPPKPVEPPAPVVTTVEATKPSESKAVGSVTPNSAPVIGEGTSAIAVGAGVGVAALGVFAALVAAQDQNSSEEPTKATPTKAAATKLPERVPGGATKTTNGFTNEPAPLIEASTLGTASAFTNGNMQMGPLVEERKTPPRPKPTGQPLTKDSTNKSPSASYLDSL